MKLEQTDELLLLPRGIALTRSERQEMCRIFESGLRDIYNVRKFHQGTVVVEGVEVRYECISRAVNNRFLLRKIIDDKRREIITDIRTKEELFSFVKDNLRELIHPNGKWFKSVYSLLEATGFKGDKGETIAFKYIEQMGKSKGLNIQVLKPRKIKDDILGGIDGFFVWNDREFTVQVKPLSEKITPAVSEYRKDTNLFIAFVDGFIKELKCDYLALVDSRVNLCMLYKTKGIIPLGTHFLIPKENLVTI